MTTPHPDTPELDKILEKFWADTRYTKEVKRAGNFTETKAALTRLLAKRELEGRIVETRELSKTIERIEDSGTNTGMEWWAEQRLAELRKELAKYE
jgi:hypothetical protein